MRRYSKLKKRIESLFSPDLNLKVYCTVYHKKSCNTKFPRLWFVLDKEIIFDFVKDFKDMHTSRLVNYINNYSAMVEFPITHFDIRAVNDLIQQYIEVHADTLLHHVFPDDYFGITDILKAADRRIGKNRLSVLQDTTKSEAAKRITNVRLKNPPSTITNDNGK